MPAFAQDIAMWGNAVPCPNRSSCRGDSVRGDLLQNVNKLSRI